MEDEADIYDGIRAHFPLTFGKQTQSQTPLEQVHSSTRRSATSATESKPSSSSNNKSSNNNGNDKTFPSLSSSSKAWLDSLKNPSSKKSRDNGSQGGLNKSSHENDVEIGPPRPGAGLQDEDVMVGPPRPVVQPNEEEEDAPIIGPPRPQHIEEEDDDAMIGPPRPPTVVASSESEDEMEEEEENRHRIPLSNEIVLKGHTKVIF